MRVPLPPTWALRVLALGAVGLALAGLLLLPAPRPPHPPRPSPPVLLPAWERADGGASARLLPLTYWAHRAAHPARFTGLAPCSAFPSRAQLSLVPGARWQLFSVRGPEGVVGGGKEGSLYAHSAHWDPRAMPTPAVRALIYCDAAPLPNLTCLLWYEDRVAPVEVPATATYGWRAEWNGYVDGVNEPYVLACPAPRAATPPRAISLVRAGTPCPVPRTALPVQGAELPLPGPAAPSSVAVCIKWLEFAEDVSTNFVEWMELLRALGAERVYAYTLQGVALHDNVRRVLRHYVARGLLDVQELAHAPHTREDGMASQKRELLPYNECLYRTLGQHAWLALIDLDELIVPLEQESWPALIARETEKLRAANASSVDAFVFRNYYFLRDAQRERAAPAPARMLAHVWRARLPCAPGYYVKSFHNVSSAVTLHNHLPVACASAEGEGGAGGVRACLVRDVSLNIGRLHHYRVRCSEDADDCAELHDVVRDTSLSQRFRPVLRIVRRVLRELRIPIPH